MATGNPLIKEKMDIDTEVTRLKLLKSNFMNQKYRSDNEFKKVFPEKIKILEHEMKSIALSIKKRDARNEFEIDILGTKYLERSDAGLALESALSMQQIPETFGHYLGFPLLSMEANHKRIYVNCLGIKYGVDMGDSQVGNITRIENTVSNLDKQLKKCEELLKQCRLDMEESRINSEKQFQYEDELQSKLKRQVELDNLLEMDKKVEVLSDGESLDKEVVEKLREVIDEAMNMQHEEIVLEP